MAAHEEGSTVRHISDIPSPEEQKTLPVVEEKPQNDRLRYGLRQWIEERFNWSWFTCTQSTGGIALALADCPKQFSGLQTVGTAIFIINLVLFITFTSLTLFRWISKPSTFRSCFIVAPECYFYGSFWLSVATIIMCMDRFAIPHTGPWLIIAIRICFWIYAAATALSTTIHFVAIFQYTPMRLIDFSPALFLMVFNMMLTGTVAGTIAKSQPPHHRIPIIIAGIGYQGFGWIASMIELAWFFGKLIETGWPDPSLAPGLFITVGSVGFTIVALIGNAMAIPEGYGYFASHPMAREVLFIMATWTSVFMWVLCFWLFGIALFINVVHIIRRRAGNWELPMRFNNIWWAMIFPNVGLVLATAFIGEQLQSDAIQWLSAILIVLLFIFWLFNLVLMAKTIVVSLFVDAKHKLL